MSRLACTILAVALAATAAAQDPEPLVGDRPDFTESATTITPGRIQLEAGFSQANVEESRLTTLGELLLRFGLGKNTEGRLTLGSFAWLSEPGSKSDGLTDIALGVKQRFFLNDGLVPETALLITVTLPTGADGVTFEELQALFTGAFAWELSSIFNLGANLGYSHAYSPTFRDRFHSWWGSLALGAGVTERLGVFVEAFGYNREEKEGDANGYGDAGITYLLGEDLQLDARVGTGLNGNDNEWFWGVGVVWRF
jgi:hypothetical protein